MLSQESGCGMKALNHITFAQTVRKVGQQKHYSQNVCQTRCVAVHPLPMRQCLWTLSHREGSGNYKPADVRREVSFTQPAGGRGYFSLSSFHFFFFSERSFTILKQMSQLLVGEFLHIHNHRAVCWESYTNKNKVVSLESCKCNG